MAAPEIQNIALIREYLSALEAGEAGDSLRGFFNDDAAQIELPNLLNRNGQESNLEQLVQRSVLGQKLLSAQRYEILSIIADDDNVAVEAHWAGKLAVPLGTLSAGAEMKAAFAMFFRCREGRISSQRNYDCFYSV